MNRLFSLTILIALLLYAGLQCPVLAQEETMLKRKIKVALVYTVTTSELKADTEGEVRKQLGSDVEILNYEIPSVFHEIAEAGYVTSKASAKLISVYMKAVEDGADAILSVCSTVGDVAYSMQDAAKYLGVPIVIINEEMCRETVRQGKRIAIMATFRTSVEPTKNILHRVAREMGKRVEVTEVIVEGGFGLEPDKFKALMAAKAGEIADKVDVIVFSQGSMAYCEEHIAKMYKIPVLSNPRFAAVDLKAALVAKGLVP